MNQIITTKTVTRSGNSYVINVTKEVKTLNIEPGDNVEIIIKGLGNNYKNTEWTGDYDLWTCKTCGAKMKMHNPVRREFFCENCKVVYDGFGNKVKDIEG